MMRIRHMVGNGGVKVQGGDTENSIRQVLEDAMLVVSQRKGLSALLSSSRMKL